MSAPASAVSAVIPDNKPSLWQRFLKEILAKPPKLLPEHASLANFTQWFTQLDFGNYFTNSMVVAVITVLGNMVFCSMVGYALAKMNFAGKNILFGAVMVTLMVPSVATWEWPTPTQL